MILLILPLPLLISVGEWDAVPRVSTVIIMTFRDQPTETSPLLGNRDSHVPAEALPTGAIADPGLAETGEEAVQRERETTPASEHRAQLKYIVPAISIGV